MEAPSQHPKSIAPWFRFVSQVKRGGIPRQHQGLPLSSWILICLVGFARRGREGGRKGAESPFQTQTFSLLLYSESALSTYISIFHLSSSCKGIIPSCLHQPFNIVYMLGPQMCQNTQIQEYVHVRIYLGDTSISLRQIWITNSSICQTLLPISRSHLWQDDDESNKKNGMEGYGRKEKEGISCD